MRIGELKERIEILNPTRAYNDAAAGGRTDTYFRAVTCWASVVPIGTTSQIELLTKGVKAQYKVVTRHQQPGTIIPSSLVSWREKYLKVIDPIVCDHIKLEDSFMAEEWVSDAEAANLVQFTVTDSLGAPIAGATVTFRGDLATTDAGGIASYLQVPDGVQRFSVAKAGYVTAIGSIVMQGNQANVAIVLVAAP